MPSSPLEVSRPRLPWWTLLPGWVKLLLSPIAAVIVVCWLGYQLGRLVHRYPLTVAVIVGTGWLWMLLGEWTMTIIGGALIIFMHRANIGRLINGTENKFK